MPQAEFTSAEDEKSEEPPRGQRPRGEAHVHARPACRLVDNDDAVRHRLRLLCARHSARLRRSSVSPQGGTLPQAEFISAEDEKSEGSPRGR